MTKITNQDTHAKSGHVVYIRWYPQHSYWAHYGCLQITRKYVQCVAFLFIVFVGMLFDVKATFFIGFFPAVIVNRFLLVERPQEESNDPIRGSGILYKTNGCDHIIAKSAVKLAACVLVGNSVFNILWTPWYKLMLNPFLKTWTS